ncbi:MAG: hypothetical protein ACJAVJ_000735 [Planctomycetota bacterium]|jgi:hypothetical protein
MNLQPNQPFEHDPFESYFSDDSWSLGLSQLGRLELGTVHRRELAGLLTDAARCTLGLSSSATDYGALLRPVAGGWRDRAVGVLEMVGRDGQYFDGQELIEQRLEGGRPSPELMILAALDLWEAPQTYLALGQTLLARGDGLRAKEVYSELLRQNESGQLDDGADFPWRVREGLGAAWECVGSDVLAFGCMRAAVERRGSGTGPLVSALFLGVELGRTEEVSGFARALDRRLGRHSQRLSACSLGLRARVARRQARRGEGTWTPPAGSVGLFRSLLIGDGATAVLSRALVQGGDGQVTA